MSRTIDIPDEVYAQLEQQAKARGLTLPEIIAELTRTAEKARIGGAIARMRAKGLLLPLSTSSRPAAAEFRPVKVQGKPLSEVIIEERR